MVSLSTGHFLFRKRLQEKKRKDVPKQEAPGLAMLHKRLGSDVTMRLNILSRHLTQTVTLDSDEEFPLVSSLCRVPGVPMFVGGIYRFL